ncbi:GNAT family N-acetyltransferase [Pontibacter fetidus]|uniref:GNAT family N-acetyltransferase n=1 Tax=Pontibacter fetidus TaxID=2700082 RepID=A0A6B2H4U9_9BACT|nr:GNAT family protein [Pontibacter fetidus]NDK57148.1 GNAT family N-acetyltransferase [Pontibacter fetidus]
MQNPANLAIREMLAADINLIADYWLTSNPAFLVSMGVDLAKLPTREGLTNMLQAQLQAPYEAKQTYALIWMMDDKPAGHCNVNQIVYGKQAFMHLHLWQPENRQKGVGSELVKKSLPYFFENLRLKELYCEPYALNSAPNKTLEKVGFVFEKQYTTIPGTLNFEQEVKRWKLTKEQYLKIIPEV